MYYGELGNVTAKNNLTFRSSEFTYKSMTILLFTLKRWDLFYVILFGLKLNQKLDFPKSKGKVKSMT